MSLQLSDEVIKEIKRLCLLLHISEDTLLRRILFPEDISESTHVPGTPPILRGSNVVTNQLPVKSDGTFPVDPQPKPQGPDGLRTREGILLPDGLTLHHTHKGKEYRAMVKERAIVLDGVSKRFTSPSLAAVEITGYPVNGWQFWKYRDEENKNWCTLSHLRVIARKKITSGKQQSL